MALEDQFQSEMIISFVYPTDEGSSKSQMFVAKKALPK